MFAPGIVDDLSVMSAYYISRLSLFPRHFLAACGLPLAVSDAFVLHLRKSRPEEPAPIESVALPRKRNARVIKEEQAINRLKIENYRPPCLKPVGQAEKLR